MPPLTTFIVNARSSGTLAYVLTDSLSLANTQYSTIVGSFRNTAPPNGLCSSITESKHIKAVKELWRRTNHHNALGQMFLINQRLNKLAAMQVDFTARGMLDGPTAFDAGLLRDAAPPDANANGPQDAAVHAQGSRL